MSRISNIPVFGPAVRSRLADFHALTKPRMNLLVLITTAVGFYMAVIERFDWLLLFHTLAATAFTAAAASILNQYVEVEYDARMPRTRNRPLPAGRVGLNEALVMGIGFGIIGVAYLAIAVNPLTALLGAVTLLSYVTIYTPLKRITTLNTLVGAIPGAIPPMMGWTAVHNAISPEAIALFGILFLWQMPHFLAIAVLYKDDYAAGGFKMLPNVDPDLSVTGRQMVLYAIALIPASLLPVAFEMAGPGYFCAAVLLGLAFLSYAISAAVSRQRIDSRKLFFASIMYLPLLLAILMLDKVRII